MRHTDRISLKEMSSEKMKELQTKGHGSVDYRSDVNSRIIIVEWFQNGQFTGVSKQRNGVMCNAK